MQYVNSIADNLYPVSSPNNSCHLHPLRAAGHITFLGASVWLVVGGFVFWLVLVTGFSVFAVAATHFEERVFCFGFK